jgi:methylamine utilization protein MauE
LLFLNGLASACGVLLAVAGASKVYRGARGVTGDTAIRRALRIPRRRWRVVEPAAGAVECAVGVVVCAGVRPVVSDAVMAAIGATFCGLLGYVRVRGVPGGCGCIDWRTSAKAASRTVSWREIARSAVVLGAGIAAAAVSAGTVLARTGPAGVGEYNRVWFDLGLLAGGVVLVVLSVPALGRTPLCHRPLWRPAQATLRELTRHGVYLAMAESAGPLGPPARHHRTGCADEFWFTAPDGGGDQHAVVFQVRHTSAEGKLAVQASLRETAG